MRVTIDRDHLRDGLKTVSGAVPQRSTLPVLGMVLLSAEEGHLRLTGTNLEMALTTICECKVEEEGSLAIPLKDLKDLASKLLPGRVELWTEVPEPPEDDVDEPSNDVARGGEEETPEEAGQEGVAPKEKAPWVPPPPDTLCIQADQVEGRLFGLPATEFPEIVFKPTEPTVAAEWGGDVFRRDIEAVAMAAADDESRIVLQGILFQLAPDGYRLVAADGFRLATLGEPLKPLEHKYQTTIFRQPASAEDNADSAEEEAPAPDPWPQVVIPAHPLSVFSRLVDSDDGVTLLRGDNDYAWIFSMGDTRMLVREIEANFPDYVQILPRDEPTVTLTCSEQELRERLGVAVLYARHSALLVRLEINQDTLTLLANAADIGDSDSGVPITTYVSDPTQVEWPVRVGLNGRMLGEAIRAAASLNPTDGDRVAIRIWAPERPLVILPADTSPLSPFLVVQMPMHLTR